MGEVVMWLGLLAAAALLVGILYLVERIKRP